MKKIPYGIIDYRKLIEENYYYIDKTMYLSKLENAASTIICLRPGRFGKSLMTSMMYYYYDVNSSNLFETLFKGTYVYNNPTPKKNSYYILKFDFSGITIADRTKAELERIFNNKVIDAINYFIFYYNLDYIIEEKNITSAEILSKFLTYMSRKTNNKIYIIVDEYDNFTNGILEGDASLFENVVSETGFIKAFYAIIKEYIGLGVVDRFYATGICPVTLNSMTTGFNIATDISHDVRFNTMIGLTHEEVKKMLSELEITEEKQEELYELMIENYDGYLFNRRSEERTFSATLVMYLLSYYQEVRELPEEIIDKNITVNYGKIENIIKIKENKYYKEIIDEIIRTEEIEGILKRDINLMIGIEKNDIISLLYYFGYLTIKEESIGKDIRFRIPNQGMKEVYNSYFLKILRETEISIDTSKITESIVEIIKEGSITKISEYVSEILKLSDNRIFIKFDEKYIQALYFGLLVGMKEFNIYTEYPNKNGYIDIMIKGNKEYMNTNIMIELKYIKKSEYSNSKVEEKVREGKEQLMRYELDERIEKEKLKKYLVVYVGSELKLIENI